MQPIERRPQARQQFSVRLPQTEIDELDRLARSADCRRSDVVRHVLRLGLHALTSDDQETSS